MKTKTKTKTKRRKARRQHSQRQLTPKLLLKNSFDSNKARVRRAEALPCSAQLVAA